MILLVPLDRINEGALHLAEPQVPCLEATPLPPRSLTHVTLLILRSSEADPDRVTVDVLVE